MRSGPELIKRYVKHPLTSTREELSLNSAALGGLMKKPWQSFRAVPHEV